MDETDEAPLFSFVILGDTHITDGTSAAVDSETTRIVSGKFNALLEKIEALNPAFVVHLGDVTHPGPLSEEYADAAREFHTLAAQLGSPWYLAPGNHDIGEKLHRALPQIEEGLSISERSIAQYQQHFGPQYQSFFHEGCLFVLVNAMLFNSGLPAEVAQWDWLENTLSAHEGKRIFVCSHYPMFLTDEDEGDHYDNIGQPARRRLAGLVRPHRVEGFYSGHVHNYFYNAVDGMHHFTLPSTSINRHDYLEFFRTPPESRELGRYDPAKTGFFWIDVHKAGHVPHLIRQSVPDLRRTHAWRPGGRMPVMDLRMPWCERQEVASPWGAEIFERKFVRNDYPLSALWEMGIRELRVPVCDLRSKETAQRIRDLAGLGHRFTVVLFGLPGTAGREALKEHHAAIRQVEIVVLQEMAEAACEDLGALRRELKLPIYLNMTRTEVQGYTSGHGLCPDDAGDALWLEQSTSLCSAVDGFVFGVSKETYPLDQLASASRRARNARTGAVLHVRNVGMCRTAARTDATARCEELNRVAEAVMGARAYPEIPVVLDNFVELERGYFHCFGLYDRLYNPKEGSRIVTGLDSLLPPDLSEISTYSAQGARVVVAEGGLAGSQILVLPETGLAVDAGTRKLPQEFVSLSGISVELVSGREGKGSLGELISAMRNGEPIPVLFCPGVDSPMQSPGP